MNDTTQHAHDHTARIPPCNLTAERSVLGGLMLKIESLDTIAPLIRADDFYHETHRIIFTTMLAMRDDGTPINTITLADELNRLGKLTRNEDVLALNDLMAAVPSHGTADTAYDAKLVREAAQRRRLIYAARELETAAYDHADIDDLSARLDRARQGIAGTEADTMPPSLRSVRDLVGGFAHMREPIIFGLLREGETMNLIAASKIGKSWLATLLAIAFATRSKWLGRFDMTGGDVLIVDNELHPETSAYRIPTVANAHGIRLDEYADHVFVMNLRGELLSLPQLAITLDRIEPGRFKLIILDAFYRFLPPGTDENDNGAMAGLYNLLDRVAGKLKCAFVCIHHASKGSQSAKAVTDVGSGAGSMSRAADCHAVLRPHEEANVVVMEAATRSWPPLDPLCLRWEFPLFSEDPTLDPALLKPDRPRRPSRAESEKKTTEPVWTHQRFTKEFCQEIPQTRDAILAKAVDAGLATRKAEELFKLAEGAGLIHSWPSVVRNKRGFATVPPSADAQKNTHTSPLVPPNTKPQKRRVGVGGNGVCVKREAIAFGNRDI